ncbi:MAG TPA: hypothetical protein VK689_17265 [Armatimonadota bacterium]|nr:hypothetical protein [Armatimonadota bacterium]
MRLRTLRQNLGDDHIEVKRANVAVANLQTEFQRVQVRQAALHADQERIDRVLLKQAEAQRQELSRQAAPLVRTVDVQFRDATLKQAAQALTQVAGFPIRADESLPQDKRLTVQVQGVALGTVLEAIGKQAEIMIAPDGAGIALRSWPTLEVNGARQVMTGSMAPWSDEWQTRLPYLFSSVQIMGVGVRHFNPEGMKLLEAQGGLPGPGGGMGGFGGGMSGMGGGMGGFGGGMGGGMGGYVSGMGGGLGGGMMGGSYALGLPLPSSVSVASMGNGMLVVAQPDAGSGQGPGVWLTVYRLEGTRLKRVSALFQPSAQNQPSTGGMPGGLVPPLTAPPAGTPPRQVPRPTAPSDGGRRF